MFGGLWLASGVSQSIVLPQYLWRWTLSNLDSDGENTEGNVLLQQIDHRMLMLVVVNWNLSGFEDHLEGCV